MRKLAIVLFLLSFLAIAPACRRKNVDTVTVALPDKFSTFDTVTTTASDSAAERIRTLIFNSLIRKDPTNFDYVGELAKQIDTSPDGMTITLTLRPGVKFHNGKEFTSADVKYTFDTLFSSKGYKSGAFFDTVPISTSPASAPAAQANPPGANADARSAANAITANAKTKAVPHILGIDAPDASTVVFKIARPGLKDQLLANLVAVPIIAEGTAGELKDHPIGTGPFKFVNFDASQNTVELESNTEYWEGGPKVPKLRIKTVTDANSLQAELQTGGVDIAPNPSNLPPDTIKALGTSGNLKVEQSDGANIQYLLFNTATPPLNNPKIRQAIGYAVDRQKIVSDLLFDQAKVASSILPPNSWAYAPGTQYTYDPAKAKQLIQEAGYKNEPITFKYGSGNSYVNQYSQVIQSSLTAVGLNVQIETLEVGVIRTQLAQGQFQMYTGVWIGGNTDPIFLRDLFSSTRIPSSTVACCNRGRYSNPQVDKAVAEAIDATDQSQAKASYASVWNTVSDDLPLLPLWYPANIVVANKRINNIKMTGTGDWVFLKDITVQ